jgi:hypothetical protein
VTFVDEFDEEGESEGETLVRKHFALQGFNPMNPAAVGHPVITENAMITDVIISQFKVTNYAAKPVQSIEYGWRISSPTACSDSTLPVRWDTAAAKVNIAPDAKPASLRRKA